MLSPTKPYSERKTIGVFASQVGRENGAQSLSRELPRPPKKIM